MKHELINAFIGAIRGAGLIPLEAIGDKLAAGGPVYFRCEGDKPCERKGWAVLHLDGRVAGAFGHFRLGLNERWCAEQIRNPRLASRRPFVQYRRTEGVEYDFGRLRKQQSAAADCLRRWTEAGPVDPRHPYLVKKGIVGEGLRQKGNLLLVPMYDGVGQIWNLQTISPTASKRFAKSARTEGLHLVLGDVGETLAIAEGYGTAAVIRRATALPVAVSFSANRLVETARLMRDRFPRVDIIIGADDDAHLVDNPNIGKNVGLEAAYAAARAVGGRIAVPPRIAS